MKSYLDYQNEALDEAVRLAKAAREHSDRAELYIAGARRALKQAAAINKRVDK